MKRALVLSSALVAFGGVALAQGSDDCATAQAISGLGPHFFDNTAATTDGPADCEGKPARKDVWFKWTAPGPNGGHVISTCGLTSLATRIDIYDAQACPVTSAPIGCSATGCSAGPETRFSFPTVAGQDYLIRIGSKAAGQAGTGQFEFVYDPCWLIPDDGFEDNDFCEDATPLSDGLYQGLKVSKVDADWYAIDVADGATVTIDVLFTHATGNLETYMYDQCGGTFLVNGGSSDDNEQMVWTNNTGACVRAVFQVQHWLSDPNTECNTYDLQIQGASPFGTCASCPDLVFCDTNPDNFGDISIDTCDCGMGSINVTLSNAPANQFGYLLVGQGTVTVTNPPGAQGDLCLGGSPIGRYTSDPRVTDAGGSFSTDILNAASGGGGGNIPTIGGNLCSPAGQSWNFQNWFRDGMNPSKFSKAMKVTFQ